MAHSVCNVLQLGCLPRGAGAYTRFRSHWVSTGHTVMLRKLAGWEEIVDSSTDWCEDLSPYTCLLFLFVSSFMCIMCVYCLIMLEGYLRPDQQAAY